MFMPTKRCLPQTAGLSSIWLITVVTFFVIMYASAAGAQGPTNVTFWHALGGDHQVILNDLVDQFNTENPDVVINAEYQGGYGDLQQKLIAAVAANRPPTVSLVYNNWTAAFVEGGTIVPVATFFDDPQHGLSEEEIAEFNAAFIEANSWDGTWTTMPFNKSIYVLYYNKDLLDKAGVQVPRTMDELRTAANAVTEKTNARGLAIQANFDQFGVFLHAFGGSWLDADGQSAFNGESGVAALQFLHDLVHVDKAAYYHDGYLDDEFNLGNAAMFIATVATIPWLSSDHHEWGAAPIPQGAVKASVVQGTDLAIFQRADEQQQLAAWRFIKYLTSPEVNARWAVETGYLPVTVSATETDLYKAHIASDPAKYDAGPSQLEYARFDPGLTAWFEAREFITLAAQRVLIARVSPQQALDEAAERTNRALAN